MRVLKSSQFFRWTARRTLAAQLVAEDRANEQEIAERVGVSRRALFKWRVHPVFAARVASIVEETRAKIMTDGIAVKINRLRALQERFDGMQRIISERAADPSMQGVPGGTTGLIIAEPALIRTYRTEAGDDSTLHGPSRSVILYNYVVDVALLREMRETLKQAAIEVGDWMERREVRTDGPLVAFTIKIDQPSFDHDAYAARFKQLTGAPTYSAEYPEGAIA